jgi:hypothetical protein
MAHSIISIMATKYMDTACILMSEGDAPPPPGSPLETRKVQYNSLTMLLSSFMQEFGPISSRVYCIFAHITNNKFVVELSIRNLNKCSI